MPILPRLIYRAAGQLARAAAAVTPEGGGKLRRTLHARRDIRRRYKDWGSRARDIARRLLWMHAPSVGEGLQARPVLELARARRPGLQTAYTFFSPSAERFAGSLDADFVDYLPFDTAGDASAALDALRPTALVFSKLDVWPMLVRESSRRGVGLGLVSATLSEGSSRRSGIAAALLREAYARLDLVGAISEHDAQRLVDLGVRPAAISVTGDVRYDQVWARANSAPASDHAATHVVRLASRRPTLVAGSTWPADEAVLLEAWSRFVHGAPDSRLIIAPHEPTETHLAAVEEWARHARLRLKRLADQPSDDADVVLVDRVGVLGDLYALADAAFVGGAFHAAGLHSVLEPAAFGAPAIFGPQYASSRDAVELMSASGARSVSNATEMLRVLNEWLVDHQARAAAGAAALAVVRDGLGAAERSWGLVERLLLSSRA